VQAAFLDFEHMGGMAFDGKIGFCHGIDLRLQL
jgi:hypothetical protein